MIGNLGPILSGMTMSFVSKYIKTFIKDDDQVFELSLKILTITMVLAGGLITLAHNLTRSIQAKESVASATVSPVNSKSPTKPTTIPSKVAAVTPKMTFMESLKLLATDKYLRNVAIMVLSYGLTMEFTEIVWKATVKKAFPVRSEYLAFNGRCSTLVGTSSFIMMIVGVNVVKRLGWRAGAMMTPLMMGLLALPFFVSLIFGGLGVSNQDSAVTKKALLVAVYVGLVQNVLSKGTKYAIFDPTKEMTYIPLDKDSKTKGKLI
jgi:ATP:ADP antiporter, AAA family